MFLGVLFLIIFLQLLCIGANFPVLPAFNRLLGAENVAIGVLYFALSAPRALASPFWGLASDRLGRKPLMIFGGIAVMASSILWILADSWWVLALSLTIGSLFSAQAVVAAAMISDRIPQANRAAAFGVVGAAVSLGLTLGPLWGALVSMKFGPAAVGYGFLLIQAISLAVVIGFLPETLDRTTLKTPTERGSFFQPLKNLSSSGRRILALALVASLIFGAFTGAMPMVTKQAYGWSERDFGLIFALLGFTSALTQGGLLRGLLKVTSESMLFLFGYTMLLMGYLLFIFGGIEGLWIGVVVLAVGGGIALPCLTSNLTKVVPQTEQGQVLGFNQSLQTLGRSIGPLIAVAGFVVHPLGAYVLPIVIGVIAVVLMSNKAGSNRKAI